jgi:RNA polymerase sigma-70 factor (ECF subfamily)
MMVMEVPDTERIWRDLHTSLRRFVGRRVSESADADDIVQRVFLQVHRSLPMLRDGDRLHAWLYQTARHAIADHYRAPARREIAAGLSSEVAPDEPAPERGDDRAALRELASCLEPLLASLTPADREALHLVEVEGLTQIEAARRLGLSSSGMKSRVQRARHRLRGVVEACCRVELDRRGRIIDFEPCSADACGCQTADATPASPPAGVDRRSR